MSRTVVLVLVVLAMTSPLAWATLGSFVPDQRLGGAGALLPQELVLDHYRTLFRERAFLGPLANSLVVASATTALCLAIGSPCAYALARLAFRGRAAVLAFVLSVSMLPQISILSPLYTLLRTVGLIDTLAGLVMVYVTFSLPLTVWLLTVHFRQIPKEVEEAALVDGASRLRALVLIVAPLAWPGIAASGIVTFVYCWNELLFALSFTTRPESWTVPVALAHLPGRHQIPWGQVLAASVVATTPVALCVALLQRRIVPGLVAGAVKG